MLRTYAIYTIAVGVGIFAPIFVLWVARTTPIGASPVVVAVSVVLALAFTSALLASFLPRHWIFTTSLVSLPIAVLGSVMFLVLASRGGSWWEWVALHPLLSQRFSAPQWFLDWLSLRARSRADVRCQMEIRAIQPLDANVGRP